MHVHWTTPNLTRGLTSIRRSQLPHTQTFHITHAMLASYIPNSTTRNNSPEGNGHIRIMFHIISACYDKKLGMGLGMRLTMCIFTFVPVEQQKLSCHTMMLLLLALPTSMDVFHSLIVDYLQIPPIIKLHKSPGNHTHKITGILTIR